MGEAVKIHQMEENSIPQLSVSDLGTDTSSSLFQRRIEFHLASKPFTGFISAKNSGGFQLETLNPKSETLRGNGALSTAGKKVGNVADAVMESNGFDPEVSLGIAFRKIMRIGAGLQNLGNTCFLNAVLQCLTYTEPLAAYLESGKHQNSCRMAGFCALCAIQKHVSRALQATGKILAPKDLVSNLRCISRKFQNARQEDAHEYMVNLLESMHKCCLPSGVPSESPSAYEKSLVHKIFGGRLRSQVKCVQCNYCSDKFDPFLDLSLEILKADSLHKALEHFTARELLDGGQKEYQCQQCKQKVKATKRLTIDKAPPVLTIHLKRFGSYVGQKIDKKIHYGPTLDLQKFVSGSYGDELKYTLYGVLVHAGWSTHSGHYYCFVRTSSGNWYSLDDNRVVQVNERKVLEQKAYMLFYVRDRKSPVPKKPMVDVTHTGNMITNGTGNKMYSNHTQRVKDTVPNGFHVKNADSINGAKVEREKLNPKVSEGTSTECLVPPEFNEVADNGRVVKPENLSRVPGTADGGKEPSVVDTKVEPCANPTVPLSNGLRKFENKCNVPLPNGNVDSKELTCSVIPFSANNLKHEACNNGNTNSQVVKDISNGSFGDSAGEVNSDVGQRNVGAKPDGVVSQLTITSSSAKEEPLGKTCLKAKKKSFKSRVISMHLSFMMLDPALGLHRKKKLKHMKHKIGRKKRRNPCSSDANKAAPDLGPSTSEVSHTSISSKLSAKRKSKSGPSDGDNANHDVRVVNNATILANNKQPQKCCNSSPSIRHQGDNATQRGLMDMLTRGLESRVARWNDVEVPPLDGIEQNVDGVATIGYIGDEWDEHYDMGKRKKVRSSKNEFGGPNPFQEAASKKALKKARHERSSSANQPFRI